ncbi:MAG: glycosyltransferase family 4 protein [Deltaproteobacteria bacterium]|nr:glycosyltransferase family 4 protein [Deltaproteobacteria bacterium]
MGRVLLNYITAARLKGQNHSLISLDYANDAAKGIAKKECIPLLEKMYWKEKEHFALLKKADMVVVHWWNHPLLYAWIGAERLPKARVLVWSHVSGFYSPQIITDSLVNWPDIFAVANPISFNVPAITALTTKSKAERLRLIFSSGGLSHVQDYSVREHSKFRVGYLGTVDYAKMHPDFLDLCLKACQEDTVFPVAGGPSHESLRKEAEARGASDKFEILGPIDNVGEFLATLDVFGYPLIREHFGTGEQVLIEAMAVGVPPVVLGKGSEEYVVEDEVTGLVADDLEDYSRCIDRLKYDTELRRSLSKTAAENAKKRFSIESTISSFDSIYSELMELPKTTKNFAKNGKDLSPDRIFLLSQGTLATEIYQSLEEGNHGNFLSNANVEALPACCWSQTRGSVYHYSFFFPENKRLARWAEIMTAVDPREKRIRDN